MALYTPYAWKSARSRGYHTSNTQDEQDSQRAEMAARGRTAVFTRGKISGYSSRPGAPIAANDTMHNLGIEGDIGTDERKNNWRRFFGPLNRSSVPPVAPVPGAMPPSPGAGSSSEDAQAFSGITPPQSDFAPLPGSPEEDAQAMVPTTPDASVAATVDGHTDWFKRNGLPAPIKSSSEIFQKYGTPGTMAKTQSGDSEFSQYKNDPSAPADIDKNPNSWSLFMSDGNASTTDWGAPLPAI